MNQKDYTFSNKDKKFLGALMLLHFSFVLMSISFYGLYYKNKVDSCQRLSKKLETAEWALGELKKVHSEKKIDSIKQSYKKQGIDATEY